MTVIAYRDGVMASDSRAYGYDRSPVGAKRKVYRLDDGSLLGVSSANIGVPRLVRDWIAGGMKQDGVPSRLTEKMDFHALIVRPNGEATMLDEKWLPSDPVKGAFYAIGSGADFALGAMAAGKTACGAVQVACELDVWSGGEVQTVSHTV